MGVNISNKILIFDILINISLATVEKGIPFTVFPILVTIINRN